MHLDRSGIDESFRHGKADHIGRQVDGACIVNDGILKKASKAQCFLLNADVPESFVDDGPVDGGEPARLPVQGALVHYFPDVYRQIRAVDIQRAARVYQNGAGQAALLLRQHAIDDDLDAGKGLGFHHQVAVHHQVIVKSNSREPVGSVFIRHGGIRSGGNHQCHLPEHGKTNIQVFRNGECSRTKNVGQPIDGEGFNGDVTLGDQ